ncbi:MAG: hypothetical protein JWN24_4658 [Phycisphaerales bacterium]|nr:hypothetical protein [Phycisphaerales bacterium]
MTSIQSYAHNLAAHGHENGGLQSAPSGTGISAGQRQAAPTFAGTIRACLAGRWPTAIGLGLLTAALAAGIGWMAGKPVYSSEGLIRIAYQLPSVFHGQDQDATPVEIYEALLQAQEATMSSRPLIESAMQQAEWSATGRGNSRQQVDWFANTLKVEHRSGTDYLKVTFLDRDPAVAGAAVRSVVGAFSHSYRTQEEASVHQRLQSLEQRQHELSARHDELRKQADAAAGGIAAEDLDRLHESAVHEVGRLEAALADVRLAVIARSHNAAPTDPQQIAMTDPVMRGYLADRDRIRDELTQLRVIGYGESHPAVLRRQLALDVVSHRIADYAKEFHDRGGTPAPNRLPANGQPAGAGASDTPLITAGQSLESLRALEASITSLCDNAKKEMVTLGGKRSRLQSLTAAANETEKDLMDVTRRVEETRLEGSAGGRLNIVSAGSTPTKPFRDRRLPGAAIAAVVGACLPASIIVLFELAGTRYRRVHQTQTDWRDHARLLGVLPALPESPAQSQWTDAAHSVHQIRVALQIGRPAHNGQGLSFLISSATPGEGKTSLTAALGLAFAISGSRTLLIDCDLASRRMTRGFGLGHSPGVYETMDGKEFEKHIRTTGYPGLSVLPAGRTSPAGANAISPITVKRLLTDAARNYDVVLVDAGPILGSVEASAAASCVDGVVLVVARDQQRGLVEKSVQCLSSLQARLAGMVFNRAEAGDFYRSSYGPSSYGSMPYRSPPGEGSNTESDASRSNAITGVPGGRRARGLGPLFRAVAAAIPDTINARRSAK